MDARLHSLFPSHMTRLPHRYGLAPEQVKEAEQELEVVSAQVQTAPAEHMPNVSIMGEPCSATSLPIKLHEQCQVPICMRNVSLRHAMCTSILTSRHSAAWTGHEWHLTLNCVLDLSIHSQLYQAILLSQAMLLSLPAHAAKAHIKG